MVWVGLGWFALVWDLLDRFEYCIDNIVLFLLSLDKFGKRWKGLVLLPHVGSTRVCQTLKRNMSRFYNSEESLDTILDEDLESNLPTNNQLLLEVYGEKKDF